MFKTVFCRSSLLLLTYLMIILPQAAFSATLSVGNGKPYSTIQAAVDASRPGDTVLVYDGTYKESVVIDNGNENLNLTIKSVNEYGAIMDGERSLPFAFLIQPSDGERGSNYTGGVHIIGMRFRNYDTRLDSSSIKGVVKFLRGAHGCSIRWSYFDNNIAEGENNGIIRISQSSCVVRGNKFVENDSIPHSTLSISDSNDMLTELNRFYDTNTLYNVYHRAYSNNGRIRYNYFSDWNRFRMSTGLTFTHNIFAKGMQRHDQLYDDIIENDTHTRNTYIQQGDHPGCIMGTQFDGSTVSYNVYVGKTKWAIYAYGIGFDGGTINLMHNRFDSTNVGDFIGPSENVKWSAVSQTDNIGTTVTYNSTTGETNLLSSGYGADLKIDVWPFTTHNGSSLASDYPYSGNNMPQPSIDPQPTPIDSQPTPTDPQPVTVSSITKEYNAITNNLPINLLGEETLGSSATVKVFIPDDLSHATSAVLIADGYDLDSIEDTGKLYINDLNTPYNLPQAFDRSTGSSDDPNGFNFNPEIPISALRPGANIILFTHDCCTGYTIESLKLKVVYSQQPSKEIPRIPSGLRIYTSPNND